MTTLTSASPAFGGNQMLPGPAPANLQSGASGMNVGDFIAVIRQRMIFIILFGSFLAALACGGVIYWYVKYPGFVADSYVEVISLQPSDPNEPFGAERIDQQRVERVINSQIVMMTHPLVLNEALRVPELRNTVWYAEAQEEAKQKGEDPRDILKDMLSVGRVPQSDLIRVSANWRVKDEVAPIVNTVVNQYYNEVNKRSKEDITKQMEELRNELSRAKKLLDDKKKEIETFTLTDDFGGSGGASIDAEVLELTTQKLELEQLVSNLRQIRDEIVNKKPGDLNITPELTELMNSDPDIYQANQRLREARQSYEILSSRYLPNHDMVKQAKSRLDIADQEIRGLRADRIVQFQRRRIEEAETKFNNANNLLLDISDKLQAAKAKQKDKDTKLTQRINLEEDKVILLNQYQSLQEKQQTLEMIGRQNKSVRVEILQKAVPPTRISTPNLKMMLPAGVFTGFGIALAMAFGLHFLDKSVRTPRDVSNAQLPVLGTIPTTDDDEVEIERVETACLDAPHSVVAEAFRNLRANLFFSAPAEQQGVILVTSPSGGNGKTTVATNLAISIALSGRRVLLVDANFRRAATSELFPNMNVEGLSNILIGQGQLRDYVTSTSVPGLDVLSAGPIPPNPAELLGSSYLRDVIVDARSRYDQVIFDGPPILLVSDAMVLAGAVDGCLLVCQYRKTSRGALQRSRANLESINARIFGAVLNEVQSRRGGYFRKQYREFYDYHEVDEDKAPRPTLEISHREDDDDDDRRDDFGGGGEPDMPIPPAPKSAGRKRPASTKKPEPTAETPKPTTTAEPYSSNINDAPIPPESFGQTDVVAPEIDAGSAVDLGTLPDLSDLEELDIRSDFDIDSGSLEADSATDTAAGEDDIDIDELADELEELGGEGFNVDERFDLGDDLSDDDNKRNP